MKPLQAAAAVVCKLVVVSEELFAHVVETLSRSDVPGSFVVA